MATLNQLTCQTNASNTGYGACYFDPGFIVGAFITPKGFELDVTNVQTALQAAVTAANKGQRIYPIYNLEGGKDSSESVVEDKKSYGATHIVRDGFNKWQFEYVSGGLTLLQALRSFNGNSWDFLFIDSKNRIIGSVGSTPTKLRAISSNGGNFYAEPFKISDGSKVTGYNLDFMFNPKYVNELAAWVQLPEEFDLPSTIMGIQNINIAVVADTTSGSYDVTLTSGGVNIGALYATQLQTTSLWKPSNAQTGNPIAVTGVTYNSATGVFVVALTKTDTNYPTNAGDSITFSLDTVTNLYTALQAYYESIPTTVVHN